MSSMPRWLVVFALVLLAVSLWAQGDVQHNVNPSSLEGLYVSGHDDGTGRIDYYYYLRFYGDGRVLAASATAGTPPSTVAMWFQEAKEHDPKVQFGTYKLDQSSLSFSTTSNYGTVDYNGKVVGDTLEFDTYSHINGFRGHRVFHLMVPAH